MLIIKDAVYKGNFCRMASGCMCSAVADSCRGPGEAHGVGSVV